MGCARDVISFAWRVCRWQAVGRPHGLGRGRGLGWWTGWAWVVGLGGMLAAGAAPPQELVVEEEFQVRGWTRSAGLPGTRVRALAVTEDHHVWIGTEAGLARFDGLTFQRFHRGNTPAFSDDGVTALAAAAGGDLWVALTRSVVVFGSGQGIEVVPAQPGVPWAAQGVWPRRPGGVWLRGNVGWVAWERGQRNRRGGPSLSAAYAVHQGTDGTLWEALAGSVRRYPPGPSDAPVEYPLAGEVGPEAFRAEFALGGAGAVYLLYGRVDQAAQMRLCELTDAGPRELARGLTPNGLSPLSPVVDVEGTVWYAAGRGWLGRVRGGRFERLKLPGRAEHIVTLAMDYEGSLWAGLESSGLLQLRPRRIRSWTEAHGLPGSDVRAVLPDGKGGVWVGTSQGLAKVENQGSVEVEAALAGYGVRSVASDGSRGLWVGTTRGLFLLGGGGLQSIGLPLVSDPGDSSQLGSLKIRDLAITRGGDLWVVSGKAVSVVRAGGAEVRCVGVMDQLGPTAVLEGREGNVWVASERGVAMFSAATLAAVDWSRLPGPGLVAVRGGGAWLFPPDLVLTSTNGLSSPHAWEIYEDRQGALWIACDNGLNVLTEDNARRGGTEAGVAKVPRVFVLTRSHGLPDHQINGLTEDAGGNLWCSTDQGVFAAPLAEYMAVVSGRAPRVQAVMFSSADGLPDDETHGRISHPTVARTADGRVWVATAGGLAGFDPGGLLERAVLPRVALEQVLVDDEVVYSTLPGEGGFGLGGGLAGGSLAGLMLPPGRGRVLQFHFTAPGFVAPGQQRFRYQMAGYESDRGWHEVGTRRLAIYTNLDPGDYRFRVQAASHHGDWSDHTAEFVFRLAPHFWQTTTFRVVLGLGVAIGIYGLAAWRLREVRRHERLERQNALLRERASIARDIHDDLGPRLTQLALLTERPLGSLVSGAGTGEAAQLAGLARELAETLDGTLWTVEPSGDTLRHFADYLGDYAQEFVRPTSLRLVLDLPQDLPSLPLTRGHKRHLLLMVKEALHNVVKHAGAQTVTLGLRVESEGFTIEVRDDGQGLPVVAGGGVRDGVATAAPGGLGLSSLRQRAEAVGGNLELISTPGGGTVVRVWVPRGGSGRDAIH